MVTDMTNQLPSCRARSSIHMQSKHIAIIQALARHIVVMEFKRLAVHVKDVTMASISVNVPYDGIFKAHLEHRDVGVRVPVQGVENCDA
jgi:hypothetical protein